MTYPPPEPPPSTDPPPPYGPGSDRPGYDMPPGPGPGAPGYGQYPETYGYGQPSPGNQPPPGYGYSQPPPGYGYGQPAGYGYGQPPAYYPANPYGYGPARETEGLAIASLVVSCAAVLGLCTWGIGGLLGIVGAILGHVARRHIRQNGKSGDGMALAGIIVGWILAAICLVVAVVMIILATHDSADTI